MLREGHIVGDAQLHKHGGELTSVSGSQVNKGHACRQGDACLIKHMLHERGLFVKSNDDLRISQYGEGRQDGGHGVGGLWRNSSVSPAASIGSESMFGRQELHASSVRSS